MSSSNGSNSRLDRIERLIEQRERASKEADARNEKAHERFERANERFERRMSRQEDHLRRWAALGVKEARSQRKSMAELKAVLRQFLSSQRGRNGHS